MIYKYRLIKSTWGIAIDISAEWFAVNTPPPNAILICHQLWLTYEGELNANELYNLMLGFKMVSNYINKPVLIKILKIEYNPTDYQVEGLIAASANWAAEAFSFPKPEIVCEYSKNKYIFEKLNV